MTTLKETLLFVVWCIFVALTNIHAAAWLSSGSAALASAAWSLVIAGSYAFGCWAQHAYDSKQPAAPERWDADAYRQVCDAVEDWKNRALQAESILEQMNEESGPTFMGEPVLPATSSHPSGRTR